MTERCTYCGHDADVTACCTEHPDARICGLCRKARQGSKFPHRVPDKRRVRREPGVLVPPFPARFWGDEYRARLDALMVTSAKATPCTICGRLLIAPAGSTHDTCITGEIPARRFERVPVFDLIELALQGLGGVATSEPWARGVARARDEGEAA